jgi:LysM repeat protein
VGVKNDDGKKMILFKVKAKDSYYSIARRYHLKPEALMKYNGAKKTTLTIGAIVEVPTNMPFKKSERDDSEKPEKLSKKEKKEKAEREEAAEAKEKKKHKHAESTEQPEETETANTPPPSAPVQTPEQHVTQAPVQQPAVQQPAPQPVQQPVQAPAPPAGPPIQYKVSAGETLYGISKRFNSTVDDITKLNNLTSTNLQPGQILLVPSGQAATTTAARPAAAANAPAAMTPAKRDTTPTTSVVVVNKDSASRHANGNRFGLFEKNENGIATWVDDPGLDPNKKLVLHRTAPIGTVIKITNPMTNRTTFAKVVGTFTDTEATKDVIIVMTKNVADALGALDKRFHVDISYGSPNE